jgi:ATP-dependent Clp protease ATP-binding subunit ClpC
MPPPPLREARLELEKVEKQFKQIPEAEQYLRTFPLRDRKKELQEQIDRLDEEWRDQRDNAKIEVTEDEVAYIVQSWTGIPVTRLVEAETTKLLHMEDVLHNRVIGQEEAIIAVSKAVRRARSGLKDPKRPTGSFIFLGPTGVGKTELARALAHFLFDNEDALIKIDMSEYMERFAVSRLVGAPPGYVGYEEGGQLTEAVRRRPYSVVLLDEIEKAHPEVFNILLQMMEDGRLTDSQGRIVDFKNTVIIMTSNVGAHMLSDDRRPGFRPPVRELTERGHESMRNKVMDELKRAFRPEFLNRVDDIIVFHSLTAQEIHRIVDLMLNQVNKQLATQGLSLHVDEDVKELLSREGYDPNYGARPLRRAVQRLIEDPLSEQVLLGRFSEGDRIEGFVDDGKLAFRKAELLVEPEIREPVAV